MKDQLGNDVPAQALPFAQWLEERGWHYLREYIPAGEYEDENGELVAYEGFWEQMICHERSPEWPREEGIWFFCMSVSDQVLRHEKMWPQILELAATCSEAERTSCRVPYIEAST